MTDVTNTRTIPRPLGGYLWCREDLHRGAPCIRGTDVLVTRVAKRFAAGEPLGIVAADEGITHSHAEAALRLVLLVKGVSLGSLRAQERIARYLPA